MVVAVRLKWDGDGNEKLEPQAIGLFRPFDSNSSDSCEQNQEPHQQTEAAISIDCQIEDDGRTIKNYLKKIIATPSECIRLKHPVVSLCTLRLNC